MATAVIEGKRVKDGKRTEVWLSEATLRALKAHAGESGLPGSVIVEEALRAHLEALGVPVRRRRRPRPGR